MSKSRLRRKRQWRVVEVHLGQDREFDAVRLDGAFNQGTDDLVIAAGERQGNAFRHGTALVVRLEREARHRAGASDKRLPPRRQCRRICTARPKEQWCICCSAAHIIGHVSPNRPRPANPLLQDWSTPFGLPPFAATKPKHYLPAFQAAIAEHEQEIAAIAGDDDGQASFRKHHRCPGTQRTPPPPDLCPVSQYLRHRR